MVTVSLALARSKLARALIGAFCLVLGLALLAGAAAAQESVIVALGDSNTQGYGVAPQQAFPARLEAMLRSSGLSVRVVNAGMAGDTFGDILARVDVSVPPGTQLVIVQGGYNDLNNEVSPDLTLANLRGILSRMQARGVKTVLCGFFYKNWDAIGRMLATQYKLTFVPGSTCYDQNNTGSDDLHMSAAGHAIVAARLARVIRPMLSGSNATAQVPYSVRRAN